MVEVFLAAAIICFPYKGVEECHNVLLGSKTYAGTYQLQQRLTETPGYGGDVLQYDENDTTVFAIHRVWTLKAEQDRANRIASGDPRRRKDVTAGCVNVSYKTYAKLVECCSTSRLIIK